ncbi:hypothetical protein ZIOFF_021524 [Zingiber officinale]|uniref:Ty3 transposon capsid-like protein domain-containing protein n=1 Tax=Zingiber officinale TaxID=94328 RepID=A0A8J5H9W5_ZINOF|nr:hypothetical protein ZIOFF_021524 [Zingiber officinale]
MTSFATIRRGRCTGSFLFFDLVLVPFLRLAVIKGGEVGGKARGLFGSLRQGPLRLSLSCFTPFTVPDLVESCFPWSSEPLAGLLLEIRLRSASTDIGYVLYMVYTSTVEEVGLLWFSRCEPQLASMSSTISTRNINPPMRIASLEPPQPWLSSATSQMDPTDSDDSDQSELLSVTWNQDYGCFSVGTSNGFRIYNCNTFKETFRRDLKSGGFGIVEMFFRSNILALVGSGSNTQYPPNKVVIWDDHQSRCIGEFTYRSDVRGVKLRRDRIVIVLEHKIYVYDFTDLKLLHQIETLSNPKGLCCLSHHSSTSVLAYPGLHRGDVRVEHFGLKMTKSFSAHDSQISCMTLTLDGLLLATASTKGTLIRIFNTMDGTQLQEVRRGLDRAEIYSIALSPNVQWLVVSSDKGTIHVFSLRVRVAGEDASTQLAYAQAPGIAHQNSSSSLNALVSTNTGTNTNSSLHFMRGLEEQIAEISRTIQDARQPPLHTADNPTSVEYDPSRGSEVKPELPTSGTLAPRYSKMEFPTYSGEGDPLSWVKRCEKFFTNQRTTEADKVGLPAFHLVGEAQLWFDQVEQEEPEMTWKQFRDHCDILFGPPLSNNPLGELANLNQTSSVEDYQRQFQSHLARTSDLRPQQQVDLFTAGLVEDLRIDIELQKPENLGIAMNMARALERKQCFHQGGGLLRTNWSGTTTKLNTSSGDPPLAKTKTRTSARRLHLWLGPKLWELLPLASLTTEYLLTLVFRNQSLTKCVLPKYFSSEWSFAQFHLPEVTRYIAAFGSQNSVMIVGMDGRSSDIVKKLELEFEIEERSFCRCSFDLVNGGQMLQKEYVRFLETDSHRLKSTAN